MLNVWKNADGPGRLSLIVFGICVLALVAILVIR